MRHCKKGPFFVHSMRVLRSDFRFFIPKWEQASESINLKSIDTLSLVFLLNWNIWLYPEATPHITITYPTFLFTPSRYSILPRTPSLNCSKYSSCFVNAPLCDAEQSALKESFNGNHIAWRECIISWSQCRHLIFIYTLYALPKSVLIGILILNIGRLTESNDKKN